MEGNVCAHDQPTRAILASLQQRIGPQKFNAWFKHGTSLSLQDGHVKVSAANPFIAGWIERHFRGELTAAAAEATGKRPALIVGVDPELSGRLRKRQLDTQARLVARGTEGGGRRPSAPDGRLRHRLSDFVVGPSNRLAFAAATEIGRAGKAPYNPLFIHGTCGVGKTHLLQGVCNAVARLRPRPRWKYLTAEQFTNEFVEGIRRKRIGRFRETYRKLDVLAIDDVHFLAAKKAIQEEFLHTFNAIQAAGKQIVLASDAHPQMVGQLSAQLASRFIAGMVVKIDAPDKPTRLEILRRKSRGMNLTLEQDVIEYVARHIRGSARELEGTLFKLAALSSLEKSPVGIEMARSALADHLSRTDSALTLGDIEAATSAFFGVTPADMHSSRRTRTVSVARMVAMFLARRNTPMSYPEIGRAMGKNHSSVVLAVKRMEKALADNADLLWSGVMGRKTMPAREVSRLLENELS